MRRLRWISIVGGMALVTFLAAHAGSGITAAPGRGSPAGQAGPGTIEGVVRRADTEEPLADVVVTLAGAALASTAVTTNSSGRFAFRDLPLGPYSVQAEAQGFLPAVPVTRGLRARGATVFMQTVSLSAQQPSTTIAITLLPTASISGLVLDQNSRPVAGVSVEALVRNHQPGRGALLPADGTSQTQTDDRGGYRLWGLAPGEYYLRAGSQGRGARRGTTVSGYATSYFPSALDFGLASTLRLTAGNESIVDFRLTPSQPIPLAVEITSSDPSALLGNSNYFLIPKDWPPADMSEIQPRPARGGRGMRIEVPRPGNYEVIAVVLNSTSDGTRAISHFGKVQVNVREDSSGTATIPVFPTFNLGVRFITNQDPALANRIPRQVSLVPNETLTPAALLPRVVSGPGVRGTIGNNDSLTLGPVTRGQFVLEFPLALAGNGYVSDIRYGGRSVLEDGIITIDREPADAVEIVLAQPGGIIQGVVRTANGDPVTTAQVVLIPEGTRRQNPVLYKRANVMPVTQGAFTIPGVTPGLYRVFAFEALPLAAERSAEFMRPFETFGRAVTARAGATIAGLDVPLIPLTQ